MRLGGSVFLTVCVIVCSILPVGKAVKERGRHRHVRETTYWLDVMVLVDRSVYQSWYDRTPTSLSVIDRKREAYINIKQYFTLLMEEVSQLYSEVGSGFRLKFNPVGFYIDSKDSSQWVVTTVFGTADADQTLTKMKNWLRSVTNDSQYDHAILFTGEDLATDHEGHTTGRGTTSTICKRPSHDSVSVIEDKGAFQSIFTVAHELGHSLSAVHDGVSNQCSVLNRYIMAANNSAPINDVNRRHPWYFSSCSKAAIDSFLSTMTQTEIETCLARRAAQDSDVPDVSSLVPGQLYNSDVQCQHLYGQRSSYCFSGNLSTICMEMACSSPLEDSQASCYRHTAATGTSCGDKKWCLSGQCVYSPDAPSVEACVKDKAGTVKGLRCDQLVKSQPALCYDEEVLAMCCHSCQTIDSGDEGCPYGNRKDGCYPEICNKIFPNGYILDYDCCHTCHFSSSWTCNDVGQIDGMTCELALKRNSVQGCYNQTLAFHCCATCQRLRQQNGKEGCEYGDKLLSGCPVSTTDGGECDLTLCCHTCGSHTDSSHALRSSHCSLPLLALSLLLLSHFLRLSK